MAKMPNRMVLVIENKVNEFGDPVVNFESKDYAECVIEELEKIKAEFEDKILLNQTVAIQILDNYIAELKGGAE